MDVALASTPPTPAPPPAPPSGFSVKKKLFFHNAATVGVFGVVGTIFNAVVISGTAHLLFSSLRMFKDDATERVVKCALALGAVLSSTDSVSTLQILDQER